MECIEDIKTLGNAIRDDETIDAFVSWSGGKDCCLSLYRAVSKGLNVRYLASMITENTGRLFPHYLTPEILRMQAEAIGIPMIQQRVRLPDHMRRESKVADYDTSYIEMLGRMKEQGINVGVFGDVSIGNRFVKDHLSWVKSVCRKAGIKPYLPLWDEERESIIGDIINLGFEPIIIVADNHRLGKEWLGRKINHSLLKELKKRYQESPTGKVGLYHTFIVDGPIFRKRLEIKKTNKVMVDGIWYLDIVGCNLKAKVFHDSIKVNP